MSENLKWETYKREDGDEFIVAENDRLVLSIDWEMSPWGHVIYGLHELRVYKLPELETIHIKRFESRSVAMEYAQKYAELYDLGVDG